MGIANTFTFGGVSTSDYGLVVEGSGDYSAPKRAMEAISIPGRNGAFQLDKGYYENITVEYNVVVKGDTHSDFREAISDFRNAIVSQIGYQRLEETYLPGEYRMAKYAGGLDEDPSFHGKGAVFKVKFDCKPQRWLTSGEEAITVESGDTITNPTRFESGPLLEVEGYGNIEFNGYEIELTNDVLGNIPVSTAITNKRNQSFYRISLNTDLMTLGDSFIVSGVKDHTIATPYPSVTLTQLETVSTSNISFNSNITNNILEVEAIADDMTFVYGTSSTQTAQATYNLYYSGSVLNNRTFTIQMQYDGGASIVIRIVGVGTSAAIKTVEHYTDIPEIIADSTATILGHPTYVDCDLGEAYKIAGGSIISLNQYIDLGSDLPVLAVGDTEITFDNTITNLDVIPRWWRV